MKTAYFTCSTAKNGLIHGIVKQKPDGKCSISITFPSAHARADVYKAKKIGAEIVASNFEHPAITQLIQPSTAFAKINALLTEQTQQLLQNFLKRTEENALNYFDTLVARNSWPTEKWYDLFEVQYEFHSTYGQGDMHPTPVSAEYHKKRLYKMRAAKDACFKTVKAGYDSYLQHELKWAHNHYTDSVAKLAYRLDKMGLDANNLKITTNYLGVNLDCYITDGHQTVHAYTIVAEGEVQRKHFRFLIK